MPLEDGSVQTDDHFKKICFTKFNREKPMKSMRFL